MKLLASLLLLLALLAACVSCTTFYVSPFGNDNNSGTSPSTALRTISKAVGKGTYNDIILMSGVYAGAGNSGIYITGTLSISAQPNVFVSCSQTSNSFAFGLGYNSATVNFSNFTIRDCKTGVDLSSSSGYLRTLIAKNMIMTNLVNAFVNSYSNLTLIDSQVSDVFYGVYQANYNSYLTVRGSSFYNVTVNSIFANKCYAAVNVENTVFNKGSASAIDIQCDLAVKNCSFTNLKSINGAGIWANVSTNVQVVNSLFKGNIAQSLGGAIVSEARSSLAVIGSNFISNTGFEGGAIYTAGTMNIANTTFSANKATNNGGGFSCADGQNLLTNVRFSYNTAPTGAAYSCTSCVTYGSGITLVGNTGNCPIIQNDLLKEPEDPVSIAE